MARPGEPMSSVKMITAVEREAKVLEYVKAGWGFQEIADKLGYKWPSGAFNAFKRAMQKTIQVPADEYRALHLARYEQIIKVNYPGMLQRDPRATDHVLKSLKGIAELLGLNAPKEVKLSHELAAMADRVAEGLTLNSADVLAEAERILTASGTVD
jgi:hypothetical protein